MSTPSSIILFLISVICMAFGAWRLIMLYLESRVTRQAKSDHEALHARLREVLAEGAKQNPLDYPKPLPSAIEHHRHRWNKYSACMCGAHRGADGVIRVWTRGQLVPVDGKKQPVLFVNVTGCWHYVVSTGPDPEDYRHYTAGELAAIVQHLDVIA